MAYKANFKTGWNQREIPAMMKVSGEGRVGFLYTIGTDTLTRLTTAPVAGTKYAMLAQSDDSLGARIGDNLGYGHVPVEDRDYLYSDRVHASTTAKRVAYFIVDTTDINSVSVTTTDIDPEEE